MNLTKKEIQLIVRKQLAIDLNCSPDDFDRNDSDKQSFVFCEAKENPGRRPFPRGKRHFEMYTMGSSVIVSATPDILPFIKEQLEGKNRDEAFEMPFVHGLGTCYLSDSDEELPLPVGFQYELVEQKDIPKLYALEGFKFAIGNDANHPRPDVLALYAKKDERIIAMAGASNDCEMLWQIGIDVLPENRNFGIAAALTNRLAREILHRGKVPYYGTASSNIASQRTAHRAGLFPAWTCAWKGLFNGQLTEPTS
jgi:GNAT superfamily N-acetyltransferase